MRFLDASFVTSPWFIIIILLAFFGLIAILVFILRKKIFGDKSNPDDAVRKDEKDIAQEELDRILEPVDDEDIQEKMKEYAGDEKEKKDDSDKKE